MHNLLIELLLVLVLGVSAQWLAWVLRVPSILLLLIAGFLAGPVLHWLHPDQLLGPVLLPFVSLSVAVILFEGGLSLKFTEWRKVGKIVRNLLSIGVLVTWGLASWGAYAVLGWEPALSLLLGAILVVTGPTVIIPLLRHLRLSGKVGPALKWEGMMIDPIGVILAVLAFEAILAGELHGGAAVPAIGGFFIRVLTGGVIGLAAAWIFVFMMKRYWIPDYLESAAALMFVLAAYALANQFFSEAGLVSATIMGIYLANQKLVSIKPIVEFKENLRVLLIASLFVLLAARLKWHYLFPLQADVIFFFLFMVFVVRPVSVWASSIGTEMTWRERMFLSFVAPRGIVAAAAASLFSLSLEERGYPNAEELLAVTFLVIVGTVLFYGLAATPLSFLLGVARPNPQGVLMLGAHDWAQVLAARLKEWDLKVLLVDSNARHIHEARRAGLLAVSANILSDESDERLDLTGIGYFLGMIPNDEVNSLACVHFEKTLGKTNVFQLSPDESSEATAGTHFRGRFLFDRSFNYAFLERMYNRNTRFVTETLTQDYPTAGGEAWYNRKRVLFFLRGGQLKIVTPSKSLKLEKGDRVLYLDLSDER